MSTAVTFVDQEVPAGTQNGINQVFTLVNSPQPALSLDLFLNGVKQRAGIDYTLVANTITYTTWKPAATDWQAASYRYGTVSPPTAPGVTVNSTLLKAALRKAGVTLAPGRVPAAEQMAEALGEENRMIPALNMLGMFIFTEQRSIYTTVANQQTNTIGIDPNGIATADFNGQRPWAINQANLLIPSGSTTISDVRRPIRILHRKQWAEKQYQAVYTYPESLYYDRGFSPTTGFGLVYWFPIPDQAYSVEFYCWQLVPQFSDVNDAVILPQGYEDIFVNNLAVRLDQFPWTVKVPMNPSVAVEAARGLAMLQAMNCSVPPLASDPELIAGRGTLNWLTGLQDQD